MNFAFNVHTGVYLTYFNFLSKWNGKWKFSQPKRRIEVNSSMHFPVQKCKKKWGLNLVLNHYYFICALFRSMLKKYSKLSPSVLFLWFVSFGKRAKKDFPKIGEDSFLTFFNILLNNLHDHLWLTVKFSVLENGNISLVASGMNPGFFPSARKWRRPLNLSLAFLMLSAVTVSAAPFSSWAGKRSTSPQFPFQTARRPDLAQMMHDLRELYTSENGDDSSLHQDQEEEYLPMSKRAPFSSWAGKRAPFSSWAGKRAAFSSWAGKRAPFSSWAGKRSGGFVNRIGEDDDAEDGSNNGRFKRSSEEEVSSGFEGGEPQERTRRGANSFSAWGGKRAQLQRFTRDVHNDAMVPVRVMRPHRAAFSAWGG